MSDLSKRSLIKFYVRARGHKHFHFVEKFLDYDDNMVMVEGNRLKLVQHPTTQKIFRSHVKKRPCFPEDVEQVLEPSSPGKKYFELSDQWKWDRCKFSIKPPFFVGAFSKGRVEQLDEGKRILVCPFDFSLNETQEFNFHYMFENSNELVRNCFDGFLEILDRYGAERIEITCHRGKHVLFEYYVEDLRRFRFDVTFVLDQIFLKSPILFSQSPVVKIYTDDGKILRRYFICQKFMNDDPL